jgi:hypothetical protein
MAVLGNSPVYVKLDTAITLASLQPSGQIEIVIDASSATAIDYLNISIKEKEERGKGR